MDIMHNIMDTYLYTAAAMYEFLLYIRVVVAKFYRHVTPASHYY